jgi:hypothetical protein
MTTIKKQMPSKRKPSEGDYFSILLPDERYIMGRVVRNRPSQIPILGNILVYIYNKVIDAPCISGSLSKEDLLVPPTFVNQLCWSRGYFSHVGERPLAPKDAYPNHCFARCPFSPTKHIDQFGKFVERFEPCGQYSLSGYAIVDDKICKTLGL